jgi:transglutaminase-like putative cysteine protease
MPRLRVSHRTELRYPAPVAESVNHVRLTPLSGDLQIVHEATLRTYPDAQIASYRDVYGNSVGWFQIHQPHDRLVVEALATVESRVPHRADPSVLMRSSWGLVESEAYRDENAEFLLPSTFVRWGPSIVAFADELAVEAPTPGQWLAALEYALADAISYAPGFTRVDTPIERVVQIRRGVCQDLAQVFIALARMRGIATRYVSGWLHVQGAGEPAESHAWAESYLPEIGWVQFDPTHPDPDLTGFARIGVGRDYFDVPPLRGTYLGPPAEEMSVQVTVARDD